MLDVTKICRLAITDRRIRNESAEVASELKLPTIDLRTAFLGKAGYFKDAPHLTVPGRHQLAKIVADAVTSTKTTSSAVAPTSSTRLP